MIKIAKKSLWLFVAVSALMLPSLALCAEDVPGMLPGMLPGTDIGYSNFSVSKSGITIRFTNTFNVDAKFSARVTFYDRNGNTLGYSVFGLREIPGESSIDIAGNHLSGDWKKCKRADRVDWQPMTYEVLYES